MAHRGRHHADEALLRALLCGTTIEQAAQAAHLSPRTVHRRLADPNFQARLQALRDDLVRRQADMLTAAGPAAIKSLLELLPPSVPMAVRLGAIRATLDLAAKLRVEARFEARLAALEQQWRGQAPWAPRGPQSLPPATGESPSLEGPQS